MPTKQIFSTAVTRLLTMVMAFISSIVVSKSLGPGGRGDYAVAISFAALISQFANLGLQSSNTYYVARNRSIYDGLLANSLWVSLALGGGGAVLAALFMQTTGRIVMARPLELWLATAYVAPMLFLMFASNLLVGTNQIAEYNIYELTAAVWNLMLNVMAAVWHLGVPGFLWTSVLGNWVPAIIILVWMCANRERALQDESAAVPHLSLRFRPDLLSSGLRFGLKAYLSTLMGALVIRSLVFILKDASGSAEVGYYSVATQISDALYLLPSSAALVLFPRMVRDAGGRWSSTLRALLIIGALLVVACLLAAVLIKPFIWYVLGENFMPAAPILWYLLPGTMLLGLSTVVSQFLAACGFPRSVPVVWMCAWGLVYVLSRQLVPMYGGKGAAIALSATYAFLFVALSSVAMVTQRRRAATTPEMAPVTLQA